MSKDKTNILYGFEAGELYAYVIVGGKVTTKFNADKLIWQHAYENHWM